jgi:O-antigen/teichoic acid export membrane protein
MPEDYGLMSMATILTGYAMLFADLGLGAAVIQNADATEEDTSSLFWCCLFFSLILAAACFLLSFPTAYIFKNKNLIPITQVVSILFVLSGLQIIPSSLLMKSLSFKMVGLIEMISVIMSSIGMVMIANYGGGVWTLLLGSIIKSFASLCLIYYFLKWRPKCVINFGRIRNYFKFGLTFALSNTVFYIYEKSDVYFAGRVWSSGALGYYDMALQLSKIPNDKIISLVNLVSFPVYAKFQRNDRIIEEIFMKISRLAGCIVFPLYVGGFLIGDIFINVFLGDKWKSVTLIFECLCLVQIVTVLTGLHNRIHFAQGRTRFVLYYHIALATFMGASFFIAVDHGLIAIIIPWISTYIIVNIIWILLSLKKLNIGVITYIKNLNCPFWGTFIMTIAIMICRHLTDIEHLLNERIFLISIIFLGAIVYITVLCVIDKQILLGALKMLKSQNSAFGK